MCLPNSFALRSASSGRRAAHDGAAVDAAKAAADAEATVTAAAAVAAAGVAGRGFQAVRGVSGPGPQHPSGCWLLAGNYTSAR